VVLKKLKFAFLFAAYCCLCVLFSFVVASAHDGLHEQIAEVSKQIKLDPNNAELYLKRGELHRLHRDWKKALQDYDKAQRLTPNLIFVELGRGKLFAESGQLQKALQPLNKFLGQKPDNIDALVTRARVFAKLKQYDKSANDFARAISFSQTPQPEFYLERAQVFAAEKKYEPALKVVDEGTMRLGFLVTLELYAIDLELARKSYEGALTRLDKITALMKRKEAWLARRGEILLQANRPCEARQAFNEALAALELLPQFRRNVREIKNLEAQINSKLSDKVFDNCAK